MPPKDAPHGQRQSGLICLGLALAILAAYAPLWHNQFVLFDDNDYVTGNDMVKNGLTWRGIVWAFTTFHASNWHPLTWLSHMADVQLFGLNPAGHHFTNLALHIANSILLFLLLQRLTASRWPSAMVAALFALHPLHVESVAWISERKDVLSALFWILSTWAYVRYAEKTAAHEPGTRACYLASILLFACGLMAKPMLVTLPFVFLLIDYWPLRRPGFLLREKIPWFILAAASCAVTCLAQQRGGAVTSLASEPLSARLENVPVAYARYLEKTFWPVDLSAFYPTPGHWPVGEVAAAVGLLAAVTAWVFWRIRSQPYLAVGWLWFLGTLAPVIGLVQVGSQSMADRYDYIPGIGIFILVIWAVRDIRLPAGIGILLSGLALAGCLVATWEQTQVWKDSETLFRHALAVTDRNGMMENNLGKILLQQGRPDEALPHLQRAVEFSPRFPLPHYNLGSALLAKGDVAGALAQFEIQVQLDPRDPMAQYNFGRVLAEHGLPEDALPHLETAVQLRPAAADFHYELGEVCRQTGQAAEAIRQYEQSLQILPTYVNAASSLAWVLATNPDPAARNGVKALQLAQLADQLSGGRNPKITGILAAGYAETGDFPQAIATVQRALSLAGTGQPELTGLLEAQLARYRAGRPLRDAVNSKAGGF